MCNGFKDDNLLTVTAEIGTNVAEMASWGPANRSQNLGFVLEN
jgi:hypothetical protein